jgi:hypothetical protein
MLAMVPDAARVVPSLDRRGAARSRLARSAQCARLSYEYFAIKINPQDRLAAASGVKGESELVHKSVEAAQDDTTARALWPGSH